MDDGAPPNADDADADDAWPRQADDWEWLLIQQKAWELHAFRELWTRQRHRCTAAADWAALLPTMMGRPDATADDLAWALQEPLWRLPWTQDATLSRGGLLADPRVLLTDTHLRLITQDPQLFPPQHPTMFPPLLTAVMRRLYPGTVTAAVLVPWLRTWVHQSPVPVFCPVDRTVWSLFWYTARHAGMAELVRGWLYDQPAVPPALAHLRTPAARYSMLRWILLIGLYQPGVHMRRELERWLRHEAATASEAYTKWRRWWHEGWVRHHADHADWTDRWCGLPWAAVTDILPDPWRPAVAAWVPEVASPSPALRRAFLRCIWTWAGGPLHSRLRRWRRQAWKRLGIGRFPAGWEEELVIATWHPRRVWDWCAPVDDDDTP